MRTWTIAVTITTALWGAPTAAVSQEAAPRRAGPREVLPRDVEVALARSAAPASVSGEAEVVVWNGTDFEVAEGGTNGVTCYVARSWPESLEPHCFDEEGSRTVLEVHLEETRLRHRGLDDEAIEAAVAEGFASGRFRAPERPVLSYMMSSGQVLYNDEGRRVGAWRPHLMIYYPGLTPEAMGLGAEADLDAGIVVDPGTPLSNLMVIVPAFVDPEPVPGRP